VQATVKQLVNDLFLRLYKLFFHTVEHNAAAPTIAGFHTTIFDPVPDRESASFKRIHWKSLGYAPGNPHVKSLRREVMTIHLQIGTLP